MPIINTVIAGGGTTPTGTIQITTNGITDVTNYASADVQVPTTAPALYREYEIVSSADGDYVRKTNPTSTMDFSGVIRILNPYVFSRLYEDCTNLTTANMSNLSKIGFDTTRCCEYMFSGCTGITSFNLSSLKEILGDYACQYMFSGCTSLTTAGLGHLMYVTGATGNGMAYMFNGCTGLTSVDVSSLQILYSYCMSNTFNGCSLLTTVRFDSLRDMANMGDCLRNCFTNSGITSLYFPAINTASFGSTRTQFRQMCTNVSNVTIHFPSNVQTVVEGLTGYNATAPFGASAGSVLFDLPASVLLTGANTVQYERSPKYDTGTALAWRVSYTDTDSTTYYTSGTTDPAVSDTIYSDSACTTAVTTISSIGQWS